MLMAYPSIDKKASYPAMVPYADTVEEIESLLPWNVKKTVSD